MQAHIQETFHLLHVGHPVDFCVCRRNGLGFYGILSIEFNAAHYGLSRLTGNPPDDGCTQHCLCNKEE